MKKSNGKAMLFIRRNAIYIVLAMCILAVSLSIAFMLMNKSNESVLEDQTPPQIETPGQPEDPKDPSDVILPEEPDTEPVNKPITFSMPIINVLSVVEYSDTMVWNGTLGRYSTHTAIDFFANEGTDVYAVYDGVISGVEKSVLTGNTVTIDHGNGLFTVYNSLGDGEYVTVGQSVKQGEVIGTVSSSNRQEYKSGAHLHFEVIENGEVIDPVKYLIIDEK